MYRSAIVLHGTQTNYNTDLSMQPVSPVMQRQIQNSRSLCTDELFLHIRQKFLRDLPMEANVVMSMS